MEDKNSFGGTEPGTGFLFFWSNLNWRNSGEYKHGLRGIKKNVSPMNSIFRGFNGLNKLLLKKRKNGANISATHILVRTSYLLTARRCKLNCSQGP